jgi:hypothetical protein
MVQFRTIASGCITNTLFRFRTRMLSPVFAFARPPCQWPSGCISPPEVFTIMMLSARYPVPARIESKSQAGTRTRPSWTFFVEKSELEWSEESGKQLWLTRAIPDGAVIFVRLIASMGVDHADRWPTKPNTWGPHWTVCTNSASIQSARAPPTSSLWSTVCSAHCCLPCAHSLEPPMVRIGAFLRNRPSRAFPQTDPRRNRHISARRRIVRKRWSRVRIRHRLPITESFLRGSHCESHRRMFPAVSSKSSQQLRAPRNRPLAVARRSFLPCWLSMAHSFFRSSVPDHARSLLYDSRHAFAVSSSLRRLPSCSIR